MQGWVVALSPSAAQTCTAVSEAQLRAFLGHTRQPARGVARSGPHTFWVSKPVCSALQVLSTGPSQRRSPVRQAAQAAAGPERAQLGAGARGLGAGDEVGPADHPARGLAEGVAGLVDAQPAGDRLASSVGAIAELARRAGR